MNLGIDTFLSASRLWWLLAVGGLLASYVVLQFVRRRDTIRFTNVALLDRLAPRRPGWRRHLVAGLHLMALAALVLAFARPAGEVRVPRQRATIMLTLDTSLSMKATDVDPTRIDAAKKAAEAFVRSIPPKINVGLVSFDTGARFNVNPTTDHDAVVQGIRALELHEGTSIGDAVDVALDAIARIPKAGDGRPAPAAIVLLSDGTTTVGKETAAAIPDAQKANVPVSTIAYGTPDGYIDIDVDGSGRLTRVPVPVDAQALEELAKGTGGTAFRAESAEDLGAVYQQLGSAIGYDTETKETTDSWVGLGLAVLGIGSVLSLVLLQRVP